MKIKQTQRQLNGTTLLLRELLNSYKPLNIAEKLVYNLVVGAFKKMRAKAELMTTPRTGWGINLNEQEAMALYVFLHNVYIPAERYGYEHILLMDICKEIERVHG